MPEVPFARQPAGQSNPELEEYASDMQQRHGRCEEGFPLGEAGVGRCRLNQGDTRE